MHAAALFQAVLIAATLFTSAPAAEYNDPQTLTDDELTLVKTAEARRIASIEKVYGAVVAVYDSHRQGGGSAVIYDESGLTLTNHHVVAGAGTEGWAGIADGRLYPWKLIGTDPGGDLAIIQLTGRASFPCAELVDSDRVRVGDWAMAMGNPFLLAEDQRPTVTLGIISGIKRYQGGASLNELVYGNCIQVDSSINPGNSGGPLFNIHGEIIGINGRGSFQERGRVNVGLGYAISSNQIKNFLPDLLATKIARHGTLDAIFDNRDGKVVCATINLDAPVAAAGLRLGDELVEFEGIRINSANQFTNLISTLPADWPAHVVFARDGRQKSIWVRLFALPYQTQPEPQAPPMPNEEEKKEDEHKNPPDRSKDKDQPAKDAQPPDAEKKPAGEGKDPQKKRPNEQPRAQRHGPKIPIVNAGIIRDEPLNRQNCRRLVNRWKDDSGFGRVGAEVRALRITDEIQRGGLRTGRQTILLATDGRFRVDVIEGDLRRSVGFDGQQYWTLETDNGPSGSSPELTSAKALLHPYVAQVATIAALFTEQPLEQFGTIQLDGGDKAQCRPAYRLKTIDTEGQWFYVWLSVVDERNRLNVRLLKSSPHIDGDGLSGAVTFSDWRMFHKLRLPYRRELVRGLAEDVQVSFVTTNCEALSDVTDADFQFTEDTRSHN